MVVSLDEFQRTLPVNFDKLLQVLKPSGGRRSRFGKHASGELLGSGAATHGLAASVMFASDSCTRSCGK